MWTTTKTCRACGRTFGGGDVFCPHDGSRLLAGADGEQVALDPLIGTTLDGRYRVLRVRGEGGMGIVYEGEHALIERRVAIKVLREDFCRRPEAVERFRREAKSASRIGHPNIVDVLDFGETPAGASYFVMEMLEGQDLADVLARSGALHPRRAVAIISQCCHALAAAHEKGIVHRDLKPENVLLVERDGNQDFVKIVDFGVAKISEVDWNTEVPQARTKLTRTGVVFGTPEYMSPEQAGGLIPDHRVDIYALGITLYELLTGRVPFEGHSFMSVLSKHANKPVPLLREVHPALKVSLELENVVYCALSKDPDQRFESMEEMAAALEDTPEFGAVHTRVPGATKATTRIRAMSRLPTSQLGPLHPPPVAQTGVATFLEGRRAWVGASVAAVAFAAAAAVYAATSDPLGDGTRARTRDVAQALREAPRRDAAKSKPVETAIAAPVPVVTAVGGGPAAPAPPVTPTPAPAAASIVPAPDLGAELTTSAPPAPSASPEFVTVRVTTQPVGARVRIVGGGEICAKTPCSFEASRGAPLTLQAQRGPRQTTTSIRPSDTTELYLVLETRDKGSSGDEPAAPVEELTDGLKVPAMFRDAVK